MLKKRKEKGHVVIPFVQWVYVSFFFPSSDYVTRKGCNVLLWVCNEKIQSIIKAFYVIAIAKVVTTCSIIVTNPNCGRTCQISAIGNIKCTRWGNKRRNTTKKGELHHHQWSPEIRGRSSKRLDPPMLERRRLRQLSKLATSFLRASMRVSMASIAG